LYQSRGLESSASAGEGIGVTRGSRVIVGASGSCNLKVISTEGSTKKLKTEGSKNYARAGYKQLKIDKTQKLTVHPGEKRNHFYSVAMPCFLFSAPYVAGIIVRPQPLCNNSCADLSLSISVCLNASVILSRAQAAVASKITASGGPDGGEGSKSKKIR